MFAISFVCANVTDTPDLNTINENYTSWNDLNFPMWKNVDQKSTVAPYRATPDDWCKEFNGTYAFYGRFVRGISFAQSVTCLTSK